jgi:hypothetical protein
MHHHTALYTDEIARLQSEVANLRRWSASALRDALISSREERIEELMGCSQLADEMAEAFQAPRGEAGQLDEMKAAASIINGRVGWSANVIPKIAQMVAWAACGATITVIACLDDSYLICTEHSAAPGETRCVAGELLATLAQLAHDIEALGTYTPAAESVAFAY